MARVVQREDPIYAQRRRDAEVVKQRIIGQNPDLVFKSSRMGKGEEGYSRVYIAFNVEGRRYIFYTGIEDIGQGPVVHQGEEHDYIDPRLIHHARSHAHESRRTFDRTLVNGNGEIGKKLQAIAIEAARKGRVEALGHEEFKRTLESTRSLRDRDHTPLIQ